MKYTPSEVAKAIKVFDKGYPKKGYSAAKDTLRQLANLFTGGTIVYKDEVAAPELLNALKTMLVATDFDAPLPEGHPGHEAYLNTVAKPRAKQAIAKVEGSE